MIVEVSVGLKEICDSRRLSPQILYMTSLSERKFLEIFPLEMNVVSSIPEIPY